MPVYVAGSGKPAGVLEVYEAYAPVAADIHETVTPIGIALGLALILLYAALFPILRQVTRALDARHKGLEIHASALTQALAERDKAEVRVSQAERNYRSLVEQLPLVMYITRLDETSSCIYMSPQIEQLVGYTPLECMSDPEFFVKILHPDDRERTPGGAPPGVRDRRVLLDQVPDAREGRAGGLGPRRDHDRQGPGGPAAARPGLPRRRLAADRLAEGARAPERRAQRAPRDGPPPDRRARPAEAARADRRAGRRAPRNRQHLRVPARGRRPAGRRRHRVVRRERRAKACARAKAWPAASGRRPSR